VVDEIDPLRGSHAHLPSRGKRAEIEGGLGSSGGKYRAGGIGDARVEPCGRPAVVVDKVGAAIWGLALLPSLGEGDGVCGRCGSGGGGGGSYDGRRVHRCRRRRCWGRGGGRLRTSGEGALAAWVNPCGGACGVVDVVGATFRGESTFPVGGQVRVWLRVGGHGLSGRIWQRKGKSGW